jgi:hypothetical protein
MFTINSEHSNPEFMWMLDQRVQDRMVHLNEKYERLIADYEELC